MYRNLYALGLACLALAAVFFLTFRGNARPRADFAWNNLTEPQTLDPNRMSAQPEGAIAQALFEGLTVYDPESLEPVPGVARSIRAEGLRYAFELRPDSFWVRRGEILRKPDGSPRRVTAGDFVYSWRRHLLPEFGSEYSHLLHRVRGARRFESQTAEEWKEAVRAHRERTGRPPVTPVDLDPAEREALLRSREKRWSALVGIRAPAEDRLEVELEEAAPYFLFLTSFYVLCPVCPEVVEEHGERWILPENIATNGPYWLEEWQFNSYIRMRKNRGYWETAEHARRRIAELSSLAAPSGLERRELDLLRRHGSFVERGLETLEALAVEEANTSLNLYLSGDVDYLRDVPAEIVRELIAEGERPGSGFRHIRHGPSLTIYFYAVNNSLPVFQGEPGRKLRRALSLCVDRKAIVQGLTRAGQPPGLRFVPAGIPGYPAAPLIGSGDFEKDVEEARGLVDEVRRERGPLPRLRILYNTHENHAKIAAHVQSVWREKLGIEADLSNQEWGVFLDSRRNGNFDVARASWIADYPDPNTFLDIYTTGSQNNDCRYSSALFDRIVLEFCVRTERWLEDEGLRKEMMESIESSPHFPAIRERLRPGGGTLWEALRDAAGSFAGAPPGERAIRTMAARSLLFEVAEEILVQDMPAIPIYFYTHNQLWPPELEGMHLNECDHHPPKFLRWKDGKRPAGSRLAGFPRFSPGSRGGDAAPPPGGGS